MARKTALFLLMTSPHISVVGSYVQDLAFEAKTLPEKGETRIAHHFRTGPGGKGFNQAVAAHRQGIRTLFLGALGDDVFGKHAKDFAKKERMDAAFEIHADSYTSAASIGVDQNGHNQIIVALGANNHLTTSFIEKFREKIANTKILVCQLECNMNATRKALQIGKEEGLITILNPAPINEEFSADILKDVDILTPNESEFRFLIKRLLNADHTEEELMNKLNNNDLHTMCNDLQVPTIIITMGEAGSFVSCNRMGECAPAHYRMGICSVKTVDTTGAGDAFSGGLAAGMMHYGNDICQAVRFATAVAALSVTKPGTAPAMPHKNDVENLLLQQNPAVLSRDRGISP